MCVNYQLIANEDCLLMSLFLMFSQICMNSILKLLTIISAYFTLCHFEFWYFKEVFWSVFEIILNHFDIFNLENSSTLLRKSNFRFPMGIFLKANLVSCTS